MDFLPATSAKAAEAVRFMNLGCASTAGVASSANHAGRRKSSALWRCSLRGTMSSAVRVWAPSRLHFGLLSCAGKHRYGGAGAMIDAPGLVLSLRRGPRLEAAGPLAERGLAFVRRWASARGLAEPPECRLDIESAPPEHAGLGTGTQLGLAVAAGLEMLFGSGGVFGSSAGGARRKG